MRWRAFGVVLSLALFPLAVNQVLPTLVDVLDGLFFVTTLVIPIVRYRLWAIDTVIRRSAAYALVTIAVVAGFAAIAAVGTRLASERVGFIVAAAVAAVTFAPARSYSQRLVDHFFYGQRNDPYRALSDLGRRLEAVAAPGEVLPAVVTAVAESLRLPYVAIERPADGSLLAACGELAAAADEQSRAVAAELPGRDRRQCWSLRPGAASRRSTRVTARCSVTSRARRAPPSTPRPSPPICWTRGSGWSARGKKNAAGCAATCTTASARC